MTSDELKEFKEEVRNAPKEYLLDLKEKIEKLKNELGKYDEVVIFENCIYYITTLDNERIKVDKKLDIINAKLKRLEYMK